jgi:soluble lytic murein transglycosylase-like protein
VSWWADCDLAAAFDVSDAAAQGLGQVGPHATAAAARWGVPLPWLLAIGYTESKFQPRAVSSAGARGPFQFMPATWQVASARAGYPAAQPEEWEASAHAAAWLLSALHRQFGDYTLAAAAYNAGAGSVLRAGRKVPAIPQTQRYVAAVARRWPQFQRGLATCGGAVGPVPPPPVPPTPPRPTPPPTPRPASASWPLAGALFLALVGLVTWRA